MDQAALVERARGGDGEAFANLMERHREAALRFALSILRDHHTAEDAVQEAFVAAHTALPGLREPDRFGAWLRGIVRFQCYRILRARHATLVSLEDALDLPVSGQGIEERVVQREEAERVRRAIGALPDSQRDVARLFYLEELSQREIARWLDMPLTTINNRLYAARQRLKGGLEQMASSKVELTPTQAQDGMALGTVIAVNGPVFDARFDARTPRVLTVVELTDAEGRGQETAAVVQQTGDDTVRCVVALERRQPALGSSVRATGAGMLTPLRPAAVAGAMEVFALKAERGGLLETGLKAIDLLCPYMQGGTVGLWGDIGAGKLMLLQEMLHNLGGRENRLTIFDFTLAGHGVNVALSGGNEPPSATGPLQIVHLPIDDPRDLAGPTFGAVAPQLDAVAYLTQDMGREGLWPALDPLRSSSRLLEDGGVTAEQRVLAQQVRELVTCYRELRLRVHPDDVEGLPADERQVWERARRVQNFLTQPMVMAEPYTKIPGHRVPLTETLAGVKAILEGRADEVPEDALLFVGTLEDLTI